MNTYRIKLTIIGMKEIPETLASTLAEVGCHNILMEDGYGRIYIAFDRCGWPIEAAIAPALDVIYSFMTDGELRYELEYRCH